MKLSTMVTRVAQARGTNREEAHDYMLRVAYGRLGALSKYNQKTKTKAHKAKAGTTQCSICK